MTYRGRVKGGVVVLDEGVSLPEGLEVEVAAPQDPPEGGEETPTLLERMKGFVGVAEGLPGDLSEQHDHYLYGTPKRE